MMSSISGGVATHFVTVAAVFAGILYMSCDETPSPATIAKLSGEGYYTTWHGFAIHLQQEVVLSQEEMLEQRVGLAMDSMGLPSGGLDNEIDMKCAILLLHGYPSSSNDYKELLPGLVAHAKALECGSVIAPDFLGFGLSDKPPNYNYSIAQQADLVEDVLNSAGISEVYMIAHDYGVTVALELLARDQEREQNGEELGEEDAGLFIRGTVLLNGGLFPETHRPTLAQQLLRALPPVASLIPRVVFDRTVRRTLGADFEGVTAWLDDTWAALNVKSGRRLAGTLLHYMGDRKEHRERLLSALRWALNPKLQMDACVVNGPADPISGQHMIEHLKDIVPEARVPGRVVMLEESVGHWPLQEAPFAVLDAIKGCLPVANPLLDG